MLETLNRWDLGSPRAWNNNYSLHKMMKANKRSSKAAVPTQTVLHGNRIIKSKVQKQPWLMNRKSTGNREEKRKNTAVCGCSACLAAGTPNL